MRTMSPAAHRTADRFTARMFRGLWVPAMLSSLGWALSDIPGEPALRSAFDTVASRYAIQDGLFAVPQTQGIDIEDRIILGAQLLHELIEAGL